MKNLLKISFAIAISFAMFTACTPAKKAKKNAESVNKYSMAFEVSDSVAYSIGLSMANYLERQGIRSIKITEYGNGMKAGAKLGNDSQPIIDSIGGMIQKYMVEYNEMLQAKMEADSTFQPEPMDLPVNVSYNFGVLLGNNLAIQNLGKANIDEIVLGVNHHFAKTSKFDTEVSGKVLQSYFDQTDSLRVGLNEQYLVDNKLKEGVITTASGLQYEIITKGMEKIPSEEDVVRVHYEGKLIDGKVFDSSYERGEPAEFPLNGVISGWTEGIALMPVGSKYIFTIPSDLAYGETGTRDGSIMPNSTLVFTVELLEIVK
jgi:FKBP-type peptidyl-prolyl cis-trans isomerase FklB